MKHLFLEGPIQTGKSTLLRQCLMPYKNQLGGFSSQRLIAKDATERKEPTQAYRITTASDFSLEADLNFSLPGIFQKRTADGSEKYPEVFSQYGVALLEKSKNFPLILLDEIGGAELLVPEFRDKLYEILSGPIPCIGVIKLNEKAKFMSAHAKYPQKVATLNATLRSDIKEKFHGEIITFLPESKAIDSSNINGEVLLSKQKTEEKIKEFLCGIFTTNL